MQNSYSEIKRYNLNPEFLLNSAKHVIRHLGWNVHQEFGRNIVAIISDGQNTPLSRLNVNIHRGYLILSCENDADVTLPYYFDHQTRVCQFLNTFDRHLNAFPKDQLLKQSETFGHSFSRRLYFS